MTVRELLSDESKWTQGDLARDAMGQPCCSYDCRAVRWSLLGALEKCYLHYTDLVQAKVKIGRTVTKISGVEPVVQISASGVVSACVNFSDWNNAPERTFAEVRRVIEEAGL